MNYYTVTFNLRSGQNELVKIDDADSELVETLERNGYDHGTYVDKNNPIHLKVTVKAEDKNEAEVRASKIRSKLRDEKQVFSASIQAYNALKERIPKHLAYPHNDGKAITVIMCEK